MAVTHLGDKQGSPVEKHSPFGFSAVRTIQVLWADRYALKDEILLYPGELYPFRPSTGARASAVDIKPLPAKVDESTSIPDTANYKYAILTIQYGTPGLDALDPSTLFQPSSSTSESIAPFTETAALDYTKFGWQGETQKRHLTQDEAPVFLLGRARYTVTRSNQSVIPGIAQSLISKINSSTVTPLLFSGVTFAAQTLLMEHPTFSASYKSDGTREYTVSYSMIWREETWRKFWNTKLSQFTSLVFLEDGSDYEFPAEADFSGIFP